MALLFGLATLVSTLLGGLFALKQRDRLHLVLGFSAGAVIGVAFFDLLPEAQRLTGAALDPRVPSSAVAAGFLLFMLLNRIVLLHPHAPGEDCTNQGHRGPLSAASLAVHSFLDGVGIGLGFQASTAVGLIISAAVLAHDFSDGINTVSVILRDDGPRRQAMSWLAIDALAPLVGIGSTLLFRLPATDLGIVLAVFCGFFLFIGASDLLPESHHRHPHLTTSIMTVAGAAVIYVAVRLSGG